MPLWIRNILMLGVFGAWLLYMALSFLHGAYPPLPTWFIPGATFALLSGRVIRLTKDGVSLDKDQESEDNKK